MVAGHGRKEGTGRTRHVFKTPRHAGAAAEEGLTVLLPVKQRLQRETGPCRRGGEQSAHSP